tara:strand:- start:495 stop:1361 length:867 start_codon:yes stop_codon:yes gene_type:complete
MELREGLIESATFFWSTKHVRIENIVHDLFYENEGANWSLMAWVLSDDIYKMPMRGWNNTGGFKRLYKISASMCRLVVQPCNNFRVLSMTIREALLQHHLSTKFKFVPKITSMRLIRSGTLTVPIYEVIIEMQLLTETLLNWLSRGQDEGEILAKFIEAVEALCQLKEAGICHGDIKPDNLMIHDGQIYIIDYGLATLVDGSEGGCDLFFLSWFVTHRIAQYLPVALVDLFKTQLRVNLEEIPEERLAKIQCYKDNEYVYLDRPKKNGSSAAWTTAYGIEKENLYAIT